MNLFAKSIPVGDEKVLYVCDYGYKEGDTVRFPDSLKETIVDCSNGLTLESYLVYGYFRAIMPISKEATWVKDGDDINFKHIKVFDSNLIGTEASPDGFLFTPSEMTFREPHTWQEFSTFASCFIKIKCRCCTAYH